MTEHTHTQKQTHVRTALYTTTQQSLQSNPLAHLQKNFDVPVPEKLWEHEPKVITENMEVPSAHVQTNDLIESKELQPDIILGDKKRKREGIAD